MLKRSKEKYTGVKFKTVFFGKFLPTKQEKEIIKNLISTGKKISALGIKDKHSGNFSALIKKGMIIKRAGAYPYQLKITDFVLVKNVSKNKVFVFGQNPPSSETRLHWYIYRIRPDVKSILHCHDFLVLSYPKKFKKIGYIKKLPYGSLVLAREAKNKAKKYNYLVLKNHGVVALGKDIKSAFNLIKKYHEKFKMAG